MSEISQWFSHSELRREAFKNLFKAMNSSNDQAGANNKAAPLPFLKPSATRWLVRGKVMYNLLMNWNELLAYFTVVEESKGLRADTKYKARLLLAED